MSLTGLYHVDPSELGLSPEEAQARFDALQRKLVPLWQSIRAMNQDEQTIVVVPVAHASTRTRRAPIMQAYEERFLFLLLLLRQPRARLVYVTSQAIHPSVVDYYLDLLPGVIASHARRRLFLVSPLDGSPAAAQPKLLERPRLLDADPLADPRPRSRAPRPVQHDVARARPRACALGIPMYGADPKLFPLGTKSGCRRLFAEEGVAAPARESRTSRSRGRRRRDRDDARAASRRSTRCS